MKVFVDTNVILDYVLQREHYAEAKAAIRISRISQMYIIHLCNECNENMKLSL